MEPIESYEESQKRMRSKIEGAAKDSSSKILKNVAKTFDKSREKDCQIINKLVWESLDMYKDGDFKDLNELADDLCKAIKAINK